MEILHLDIQIRSDINQYNSTFVSLVTGSRGKELFINA